MLEPALVQTLLLLGATVLVVLVFQACLRVPSQALAYLLGGRIPWLHTAGGR